MKDNLTDFVASPLFILVGWIAVGFLGKLLNLSNFWLLVGSVLVLVINFAVEAESKKNMTEEERKKDDWYNIPKGPA